MIQKTSMKTEFYPTHCRCPLNLGPIVILVVMGAYQEIREKEKYFNFERLFFVGYFFIF